MTSKISIGQLVKEVATSDATDRESQAELLAKLYDLKLTSQGYAAPEVGFMLDAATDLMRYLADGTQPTPQAMLTMITRLVVNTECCMYRSMTPSETAPIERPQEGPAPELTLKPSENLSTPMAPSFNADSSPALRIGGSPAGNQEPADLERMKLGAVLVELGLVNGQQLAEALSLQRSDRMRLGDSLTALGHLFPKDVQYGLDLQAKMREFANNQPASGSGYGKKAGLEMGEWQESLLGVILVSRDILSEADLKKGLSIHRATGMRLGEALVQHGFCNWRDVREAIRAQERMRHQCKSLSMPRPDPSGWSQGPSL